MVEFSRSNISKAVTESNGTQLPGGCSFTARVTRAAVLLDVTPCVARKPGEMPMAIGGGSYWAALEPPKCIFNELVNILEQARVRTITGVTPPADWGADPHYNIEGTDGDVLYSISIEYRGGKTQRLGFVSDELGSQKLNPDASVVAELFSELVKSLFSQMEMTQVD